MKKRIRTLALAALLSLTFTLSAGCAAKNDTDTPVEVSDTKNSTLQDDRQESKAESSDHIKIAVPEDPPSAPETDEFSDQNITNVSSPEQPETKTPAPADTGALLDNESSIASAAEQTSSQESAAPTDNTASANSAAPEASKIPIDPDSVTLSSHTLGMNVGDTVKLTAALSPANTTSTRIRWYWSNSSIIVINDKAEVTAVGPGTATITVETVNGKRDECTVTVYGEGTISPIASPHQTTTLNPAYLPYYPDYNWDAVIADLKKIGEEQYGLVWEDGLWVRNNASELGGPTGACTIEYPAHSAKACYADYDGKPVFDSAKFREDCVRMFKDLEKDFSKSSWPLSGRPFKIMVEDAGLDNRGVQDYCVYLLYN